MNVAEYYDENTQRFLKTGSGSGEDAIHRPVWADGVGDRQQAVHFVDEEILQIAGSTGAKGVIDLGCGVGGTIAYMRRRYPADYRGVTISGVQHQIGVKKLSGKADSEIILGDMTDPEILNRVRRPLKSPAVVFCIESFLHVPDGLDFLRTLGKTLMPGDSFVMCDDFLGSTGNPKSDKIVDEFRSGWHAPSLLSADQVIAAAADGGLSLTGNTDITPYLRLMRVQNLAIRVLVLLLRPLKLQAAWWDNFRGGDALQKSLSRGLLNYRILTFTKMADL